MAEHFDAHSLPVGSADVLALDGVMDGLDLVEIKFAGKHHHVGILREEAYGFDVCDIELCGDVDLHSDASGIADGGDVTGYDG